MSEGGLALAHFGPAAVEGVVTVRFGLPSTEPQTFQAKAEVVWKDACAMGLRFLSIEAGCRSSFAAWLDSLETQRQFRESTPSSHAIRGEADSIGRISTSRSDRLERDSGPAQMPD